MPAALINPFAVFLIRQFVRSVPVEIEEAALIDGASRWRIFWHIVLPSIRPGLVAVGIVVALDAWNSFLYPLVFLNSTRLFTLPLLLAQFTGQIANINFALVMAASAITIVPMLIAFLIGQRKISTAWPCPGWAANDDGNPGSGGAWLGRAVARAMFPGRVAPRAMFPGLTW